MLAITKKTLDENCFRNAQKTTDRKPPSFQLGDRAYFKNKQPGKWDLKWGPGYRIVCIEHNGYNLHTENQATGKTRSCNIKDIVHEPHIKFWNIDTQFWQSRKIHKSSHGSSNHQVKQLKMNMQCNLNNHLYIFCTYHTDLLYSIFLLGIPISARLQ